MATVSFAGLEQNFFIADAASVEFFSYSGAVYQYQTYGGHDWKLAGTGLVQTSGLLNGGTVSTAKLDLDNDSSPPEIDIWGLSAAAAALNVGGGTPEDQRDRFWDALLAGDDTLDFTMADYSVSLAFNGDGAWVMDGLTHNGGDDRFNDGGTALSGNSFLAGDWDTIAAGQAYGGDDVFTVGAFALKGDFSTIAEGASAAGGDDVIAPARLVDFAPGYFYALGDAEYVDGTLGGGDDLFVLSDVIGLVSNTTLIIGDAYYVGTTGFATGGRDTVRGSATNDLIYGDWVLSDGGGRGGRDKLWGDSGADTIVGGDRRDYLSGGDGDDILDGGRGNDVMDGDNGSDSLDGGSGNDTADGGLFDDYINGGRKHDRLSGGDGADTLYGRTGDDWISGGGAVDVISAASGADTLFGGAGDDTLVAGSGADYIDAGKGDDHVYGGSQADVFAFAKSEDRDIIFDFSPGGGDVIRLSGFGTAIDTFAELIAHASSNGFDTTIAFGGGDTLILNDVVIGQLSANDFSFG